MVDIPGVSKQNTEVLPSVTAFDLIYKEKGEGAVKWPMIRTIRLSDSKVDLKNLTI